MGSTNFTPNYNLPQFIGTDKPAWLTDVNGAFSSIDTAIKNAADAASNASSVAGSASSAATAAANTANTLDTQINTPSTGIAAVVSNHTTDITSIQSAIGTTPLTTVAQTLTGAIEEVKGDIPSTSSLIKLKSAGTLSVAFDGTKTVQQCMNEVYTQLATLTASLASNERIRFLSGRGMAQIYGSGDNDDLSMHSTMPDHLSCTSAVCGASNVEFYTWFFAANSLARTATGTFTVTNRSSEVPTAGSGASEIDYEIYEILA